MKYSLFKRAIVEFAGTFILLIAATGVIINDSFDLLGIALAPGIAVALLIVAVGHISGVHLNPAVSFAFLVARKMSVREFLIYLLAQFLGAGASCLVLRGIFTQAVAGQTRNGVNALSPNTSYVMGFAVEAFLTLILVTVIFAVSFDTSNPRASLAPIAIGLVITLNIMAMGPVTGAAFNPVRWFGPALAGGYWQNWSLYISAPLLGAALAVPLHNFLTNGNRPTAH